jgi:hypothetical protein
MCGSVLEKTRLHVDRSAIYDHFVDAQIIAKKELEWSIWRIIDYEDAKIESKKQAHNIL